ncbi:class I adenylate-forming enzyme family protein [Kitasatospora sp. NPDC056138]|uniref:class I adenylate-forming enzyme family protein n=1 Tax=Kitasatospora sp. NPDC056138 TaxID=3345724 RepID=UPI0035E27898
MMVQGGQRGEATPGEPNAIVALLSRAARSRPTGWAVRDSTRALTYPQLLEESAEEAVRLGTAGIQQGSLVVVESTHDNDYLVSYFAALICGANVMPCDPRAGAAEIEREISESGVGYHLLPRKSGTLVTRRAVRQAFSPTGLDGTPLAGGVLLPTSGTGGLPKRAVHIAERLVANATAHADAVGLTGDDCTLLVLSPAFGYCHTSQILAHLAVGGRLAFAPRPAMPADLAAAMRVAGVTNTTLVPHLLGPATVRAFSGIKTLRQLTMGGSACSTDFLGGVGSELSQVEVIQTWGMTECGPRVTTWRASRDPLRPGCVGLPIADVEVSAVVGAGSDAASLGSEAGAWGELYVRTPYAMTGYLNNADPSVLVGPDLIRTGDLGKVDADGYVYVHGRIKNLIDVGGQKVSAEEVESVIMALSGVGAVRVVGEDVPRRGQKPVAYVVRSGCETPDAQQVISAVRERLAPHKWLRDVVFVDELETTATGKIKRN